MTVRAALAEGTGALEGSCPGSPFLDAALLLSSSMGMERDRLLASMPDEVPPGPLERYRALLSRRRSGVSVAYILGYKEFYGRRYAVDPRVLVPRPDTEILVETALALLPPAGGIPSRRVRCHDAFTGSGCVGITIAAERPDVEVSLSDASPDALAVCAANARAVLGRDLELGIGDVLSAAAWPLDLVVANPPYVSTVLTDEIEAAGGSEPRSALDGGELGLDLYPALARQAFALLAEGGALVAEIGEEQGRAVKAIFEDAGFVGVEIRADLAGADRVVSGSKHAVRR
ncbi:MAG: peptide chain release factor N(5)-glutamine methyltransferase [Spirochaetes bacterium]|nr:peptide chain release factor N(5)-glutamine methyltransferase [Spirochaetota bacterium]MBU1079117.1 peptide chain release factor N(5)-glutamine methyltransferase [Spirochaetota bacterium]